MEVLQNLARIVKGYWEIFIGGNNHSKGVANLMRKEWGLRLKKNNARIGLYPLDNNFKSWI